MATIGYAGDPGPLFEAAGLSGLMDDGCSDASLTMTTSSGLSSASRTTARC